MRACWQYLKQVLRHKWFTFLECRKLEIPLLGLVHDWTKFLLSEFVPYARHFYGNYPDRHENAWVSAYYTGPTKQSVKCQFDEAWLHHQKRNKHHWQYWVLIEDDSGIMGRKGLPMPDRYRCEMLADWRGAGRAYGNPDTKAWYLKHRDRMLLHSETRAWLEWMLEIPPEDYWKGEIDE